MKYFVLLWAALYVSGTANAGVILSPLDPFVVDSTYASTSGTTPALIDFVNQTSFSVDLYWIDYSGDRVLYTTITSTRSYFQPTYLTHPWLVVESGTGGTTAQGTGTLLDAFLPVTATSDPANADTAYITASPEPSTFLMLGALLPVALLSRRTSRYVDTYSALRSARH